MSEIKAKVLGILSGPVIASLATLAPDGSPWVRFVVVGADDEMVIRFATSMGSRKVAQMKADPRVHLTAGGGSLEGPSPYVQVAGTAVVSGDPELKKAAWHEALEAYFSGPDDPDYAVVEITPVRIEYLDGTTAEPEVWEL